MASMTGIELGTDSCVLVRTRPVGAGTEVSALHPVYAADWPSHDVSLAALLRRVRREKHLPRRARVVAWHLPESAPVSDPATRAALRPLTAAGFRIDAVVSPPQALALLAASRPRRGDATAAWIALNRHGAAIAIVRGSELLFSRVFDWSYKGTASSANAQLLERYSLVAHLAPELRRGIDTVRASHGAEVESAITCGDLPDLRSLTMPLIEELNLDVETLDSIDGLILTAAARSQRAAELAPALRLACAAAAGAVPERRHVTAWLKAAAAVIAIAGVVAWAYLRWPASAPPVRATHQAPVQTRAEQRPRPANPVPAGSRLAAPPAGAAPQQSPPAQPTSGAPAPTPPYRGTSAVKTASPQPGRERVPAAQPQAAPKQPVAAPTPSKPRGQPPPPAKADEIPADTTHAQAPPPQRPKPLNAPVPGVSSILISSDRRLAVIDGRIVGVGEQVGPRVVARIEPSFVVLREPSGFELRVPLR